MSSFITDLEKAAKKNNSLLCIGLDPDLTKIPSHVHSGSDPVFSFNKAIVDATSDLVACYKPNIAFYEALGTEGLKSLTRTISYIHETTQIPVILDAKRGDVGHTAQQYAKAAFDDLKADGVTVNPYMGFDSIEPFLQYKNKGVIVLCRTSNAGAVDFQDLTVKKMKLYEYVAKTVVRWDRPYGNCMLVVGATWPRQLKTIRAIAKKMWFLVPGVGVQGGDIERTLSAGLRKDSYGLLINASRSIIYAGKKENFAQVARKEAQTMRDSINQYR